MFLNNLFLLTAKRRVVEQVNYLLFGLSPYRLTFFLDFNYT